MIIDLPHIEGNDSYHNRIMPFSGKSRIGTFIGSGTPIRHSFAFMTAHNPQTQRAAGVLVGKSDGSIDRAKLEGGLPALMSAHLINNPASINDTHGAEGYIDGQSIHAGALFEVGVAPKTAFSLFRAGITEETLATIGKPFLYCVNTEGDLIDPADSEGPYADWIWYETDYRAPNSNLYSVPTGTSFTGRTTFRGYVFGFGETPRAFSMPEFTNGRKTGFANELYPDHTQFAVNVAVAVVKLY